MSKVDFSLGAIQGAGEPAHFIKFAVVGKPGLGNDPEQLCSSDWVPFDHACTIAYLRSHSKRHPHDQDCGSTKFHHQGVESRQALFDEVFL
ncbi:MAG: hypothetical protein BWY82_02110 [Verrucomicrobia bacterium ADurb.Bin474]|nr:MAG: hypothetical protein BWY82_02110 [Verrucomicrobia bacterium ADurb.Bin474]